jgi:hypothetical protein
VRRLADPSQGWVIPAPLAWGLDLRVSDRVELIFARTEGEHPDSQEHLTFAFNQPMVSLAVVVPPPLEPPSPPVPQPPQPEPQPMPDLTQIVRTAVDAVNVKFPRLLQENTKETCGQFTERVVLELAKVDAQFGHVGKQPGQTNYRLHAVDAVMYREPKQVWDIIGGAENHPHAGQPAANPVEHGGQPWMKPIPLEQPPLPEPEPEPEPEPSGDVLKQIADLERRLARAEDELLRTSPLEQRLRELDERLTSRIDKLEDAPELPPSSFPAKVRLKGNTTPAGSNFLRHAHGVDGEFSIEAVD